MPSTTSSSSCYLTSSPSPVHFPRSGQSRNRSSLSLSLSPFAMDADDFDVLASHQRRELVAARLTESDLNLAFHLQMEEAMAASLGLHPSSSSPAPLPTPLPTAAAAAPASADDADEVFFPTRLQELELQRYQQERHDSECSRDEISRVVEELRRQAHDERFARDLAQIPEEEWQDTGDWFQRPMEEGFGEVEEPFRLYFKGLCEQAPGSRAQYVSAVGVAICNPVGKVILKVQKPMVGPQVGRKVMETRALIEGLQVVHSLGIKKLDIFFDHPPLFNHISGKWATKQRNVAEVVNKALTLQKKLEKHRMFLLPRCDVQFVFRLARDAIDTQLGKAAELRGSKEICNICLEDTDSSRMFEVDGCLHRFCFSCMKQHVEVKLLHGIIPACPHDGCKTTLNVGSSKKFLTPKLTEIMAQRVIEASIPPTEKVYCPYPKCSALMSRSEAIRPEQGSTSSQISHNESGLRKCVKCNGFFCITCKVPWHFGMSCYQHKKLNPYPRAEDAKFQFLANRNMWRQCVKCNHMIELASGCFHMTCRCGYEFCYTCGAEWKNKKATCACLLWREDFLLAEDEELEDNFEDEEDDEYERDYDYRYYY